jgi:hypothetical protein
VNSPTVKLFHNKNCRYKASHTVYSMSQEEMSVFWEVVVPVTLSKNTYLCPVPSGFRGRVISLYSSKVIDKKRYYVLFLIPEFIVQVTKLVQCSYYNTFAKIPLSTSVHFATRVRTWSIARVHCTVQGNLRSGDRIQSHKHCVFK